MSYKQLESSDAAKKFFLPNADAWDQLHNKSYNLRSWHNQKHPQSYPCIAIGVFDDYEGYYIYGFAYPEDFA